MPCWAHSHDSGSGCPGTPGAVPPQGGGGAGASWKPDLSLWMVRVSGGITQSSHLLHVFAHPDSERHTPHLPNMCPTPSFPPASHQGGMFFLRLLTQGSGSAAGWRVSAGSDSRRAHSQACSAARSLELPEPGLPRGQEVALSGKRVHGRESQDTGLPLILSSPGIY